MTPASSARLPLSRRRPHLQFILDGSVADAPGLARAAARGGVDSVQVRAKELEAGALLERVLAVIEAVRAEHPGVVVLVNERADVALLAGADGVHLPEASFGPKWAKELKRLAARSPFIVGRSIHGPAGLAAPGTGRLDYLMFGHVFATGSKPGLPPRGLESLARVVRGSPVPVVAVGGITAENARAAIEAGAAGVAVISAIRDAPDPAEAARALRRAIDAAPIDAALEESPEVEEERPEVTREGEVPCA